MLALTEFGLLRVTVPETVSTDTTVVPVLTSVPDTETTEAPTAIDEATEEESRTTAEAVKVTVALVLVLVAAALTVTTPLTPLEVSTAVT